MSYFIFPFFMFMLLIVLICVSVVNYEYKKKDNNLEKVEQGQMTILSYKGHTYIAWAINSGGGIVHDPDCDCLSKDK